VVDLCIIGTGFAGLSVASELCGSSARVVVLEAGPEHPADDSASGASARLPVRGSGSADFDADGNRFIGAGGTSRRWNGVLGRLTVADMRDWPIGADELDPWYDRAECWLHAVGGPRRHGAEPQRRNEYPTVAANSELVDHPALSKLEPVELPFAVRDQRVLRLVDHELPMLQRSATTDVHFDSAALSVRPAAGGHHVLVGHPDGSTSTIDSRRVVLAGGVLDTVRVLLASSVKHHLLGRGLHAHPRLRRAIRRHESMVATGGVARSHRLADILRASGLSSGVLDVNYTAAVPQVDVTLEQESLAHNSVGLDHTCTDLWGRPGVRFHSDLSRLDRETVNAALAHLDAACVELPGGGLDQEVEWRWFHPAGGCRMAHDSRHGVVDPFGELFHHPGLYVCGAATFPTSGAMNPTLTVVALGLRLGSRLRELHQSDEH
jgi:hypothetical protein